MFYLLSINSIARKELLKSEEYKSALNLYEKSQVKLAIVKTEEIQAWKKILELESAAKKKFPI